MNPQDNSSSAATTPPNGATPKAIAVSAKADIAKGYAVLPWQYVTEAGKRIKRPLLAGWQTNPITAASDWRWNGSGHGIVLREDDRILVVDVDVKNGAPGIATVRRWRDEAGVEIGRYAVQRTPSGGIHYIGRIPEGFPADSLPIRRTGRPDGVDLLRAKSWVGRSTGYTPTRDLPPLAELPEWPVEFLEYLADLCGAAASQTPPPQDELRAPSIDRLTEVVNATPNSGPDFEAREAYLRVGYAIKAAAGPENDAEGLELFQAWAARWDGGTNDPETVAADWRGMNGPYRVGFPYLCALADMPAIDAADEFEADTTATLALPDGFCTVGDLLNESFDGTRWLVDGLIPAEGDSLLVAKPKVGKSTLARAIAVAVAQGRPILGRNVAQGSVLYLTFAGEGNKVDAQESFRAMGAKDTDPILHYFGAWTPDFDKHLERVLTAWRPALVIVDVLNKLIRMRDLNDYAQVTERWEPFQRLFTTHGCAALYLHHARKSDSDDPIDLASGSVAITGNVESILALAKKDGRRFIVTEQRNAKQAITTARELEIDANGWPSLGLTRAERVRRDIADAVVHYLCGQGEGRERAEIFAEVACTRNAQVGILRELERTGRIVRTGGGRKGDPYVYSAVQNGDEFSSDTAAVNDDLVA